MPKNISLIKELRKIGHIFCSEKDIVEENEKGRQHIKRELPSLTERFKLAHDSIQTCQSILKLSEESIVTLGYAFYRGSIQPDDSLSFSILGAELKFNDQEIFFDLENEIEILLQKRILQHDSCHLEYCISQDAFECFRQNKNYERILPKNLKEEEDLFIEIQKLMREFNWRRSGMEAFFEDVNELLNANPHLIFSKHFIKETENLSDDNRLLLLYLCHRYVNHDEEEIFINELERRFARCGFEHNLRDLKRGRSTLITDGLIEYTNDDGFKNTQRITLSEAVKKDWLKEFEEEKLAARNKKGLVLAKDIKTRPLFYPEKERRHIHELTSLLSEARFQEIQKRLTDKGMRNGFACLFYGSPGTGKTETVYQIARETGRDIFKVDISATKSMWYGESQKIVKSIFKDYRSHTRYAQKAPILFLNEADALLGKRLEETERAVDKTENAIQNILLEEIENLEGIMICTTNLSLSLDRAFERRFLYKIEFTRPTLENRQAIWKNFFPDLLEENTIALAKGYDFSGGQIENIARRSEVFQILNGSAPSIDDLHLYCKEELKGQSTKRRIGF